MTRDDGRSASTSEAAELAAQFRAAALQRRHLEPWLNDRRHGGTILYAVDSDVVKLFTDPYRVSVARRTKRGSVPGYAEIIPGQEKEVSEAIGWVLADFIFTKLSGEWPIFVLPPAHGEITEIFEAVARDAQKDKTRALTSVTRLEAWAKSQTDLEVNYFENNLKEILATIAGARTYSAELVRFSRLLNSRKFYTLDQYLLENRIPDERARKALTPPAGIVEMVQFSQMITSWEGRFSHIPDSRFGVDARVLARLEWINNEFRNSDEFESHPFKIVFITGSQLIADVCRGYNSNRLPGPQSFGDRFIRSPRSYLGDPNVVSPMLESHAADTRLDYEVGRRLQDWVNTVLGADEKSSPETETYLQLIDGLIEADDSALRKTAAERLSVSPHLANDIREKWKSFAREVSAAALQLETQRRLTSLDDGVAAPARDRVARARLEIEQTLKASWDEAFEAALGSALTVKRSEGESSRAVPPRNFPLLYLDGHAKTNAAIGEYLRAWQAGRLTPAVYANLRDAPNQDPPHRMYLGFVAQAYVLGVTNRWQLSAVTAALAVSVARDYRGRDFGDAKKNRISGREAAFWRAYSLRSSARGSADLDRARSALRLARDYSAEDLNDAKGSGTDLDTKEIRFDAEELAIDVTAICFDIFLSDSKPRFTPQILEKAAGRLSYSIDRLEYITGKIKMADLVSDEHVFYAVSFQRIMTNYFMLALSLHGHRDLDGDDIAKRLGQFTELVNQLNLRSSNSLSYLVWIVYETAIIVFSRNAEERRQARAKFRALFNDMSKNCTMPYDRERFEFLASKVAAANR